MSALEKILRQIVFRGLYDANGKNLKPYRDATFTLAKVYPPKSIGSSPDIVIEKKHNTLFTPQPTIYEDQIDIMETVDSFLRSIGLAINSLKEGVEYNWEGRGDFHVLPPIVEKHTYKLSNGFLELNALSKQFKNTHVKDAKGKLHPVTGQYLYQFYIDKVSKFDYLYIFNQNAPLINYGLKYNGEQTFFIICDGAHRIDYSIEKLDKPISVIVVEPRTNKKLIPYYAFPVPFRPTIRLSSKKTEKMYHRLERDKIHILNDFIKKTLHYDWSEGGLSVGSLRNQVDIY